MPSWDSQVGFGACCDCFEKVLAEKKKERKLAKLAKFFAACRDTMAKCGDNGGDAANTMDRPSLFPLMRLLLPQLDRERGAYGIKETLLAKIYIDALGMGSKSADAQKLLNYRAPKNAAFDAGDFASVLFTVIQNRGYGDGGLSLADVNARLDEIVSVHANDGRKGVEKILRSMFTKMSEVQTKWLVRIILQDMRVGLGQIGILKQFHPDASDLFDVNANLRKVCVLLRDPNARRNEIEIQLFDPFRPMLADRCGADEVEKQMGNKNFYVEVKYDGERLQVHKDASNEFKFFSRNGFDFTEDFGRRPVDGGDMFVSHLAAALDPSVESVILDGEICAFNHKTNTLSQKSEKMNIRSMRSDHDMYQQCFCVYDIVYLNGKVLTNRPLKERLDVLSGVIVACPGRVQFAERFDGSTKSDVVERLNEAIDRREEGIVIKDPDSVYRPNVRSKGGWLKIKPDYSSELVDQCDLIIMGGYFGSGKHGGLITHFLLGLAVKNTDDPDADPKEFQAFCRVGSGFSIRELYDLLNKLNKHLKVVDKSKLGRAAEALGYDFGKEKPDAIIRPQKSCLLQIRAAEIIPSSSFKMGCTLRFPRVERFREDKDWMDCMTLDELETLRKQAEGKLFSRHMEDDDEIPTKKRRVLQRKPPAAVAPKYRGADTAAVMVETFALKDKVIVVEPANAKLKAELEKIVTKHGGKVEQNATAGRTFCYVETGCKIKAKNIIKGGKFDVVKSNWLLDCKDTFRPLRPSDMVHTTEETAAAFARNFDQYGDSYTQPATADSLKYSMEQVRLKGAKAKVTHATKARFESKNFAEGAYKYGLFRQAVVYVDRYAKVGDASTAIDLHPLSMDELALKMYGGMVVSELEPGVTHAVVRGKDTVRLDALKDERRNRREKFHIVTEKWIQDCVDAGRLLGEKEYEL